MISYLTRTAILALAEILPSSKTVCGPEILHHSVKYPATKAPFSHQFFRRRWIYRSTTRPPYVRTPLPLAFDLVAVQMERSQRVKPGVVGFSEKALHRDGVEPFGVRPIHLDTCWDADRPLR